MNNLANNQFNFFFLGIEAQVSVHPPEDVAFLSETEMLPSLPVINVQHTERSLVVAEIRRMIFFSVTPMKEVIIYFEFFRFKIVS